MRDLYFLGGAIDALMFSMISSVSQSFPMTSPEFAVFIDSSWKWVVQ